ncbi:MAG: nucleoid-associated protein EbfC [Acidimicrobiaceae bacterium]|jgi:DNA-binding YbaB/EbfC family protein|nr:nucleoid-associated protein EbfC [Acidimicrobiaceae bacterium]MDQ1444518.1 nucleoid-associated protein EbfC [Acidimicrobiaceae bacterium]
MSDQFDLGGLLEQAQVMQQRLMEAQAEAAEVVVQGESGGGVVKITVNGAGDFQSVQIDPKAVDPAEVDLLEDLVLAAINDAVSRAREVAQEAMDEATGGLGGLGGLNPGGLGTGGGGLAMPNG